MNTQLQPSIAGVPLPPPDLLFMEKDPGEGLAHAKGLVQQIANLVTLDDGIFLDLGCGWGRAAYGLLSIPFSGDYVGFDLLPKHTEWLRANFTPVHTNFRFEAVNIRRGFEQANEGKKTTDISALVSGPIATAIGLSVFTHVYEDTVLDYTEQVYRLLSPGRPFVFTSFLMNDSARELIGQGKSAFSLQHKVNDHCFFDKPEAPRTVISYSEDWLCDKLRGQGYEIDRVVYGNWCGRNRSTYSEGQDWIVARRPL